MTSRQTVQSRAAVVAAPLPSPPPHRFGLTVVPGWTPRRLARAPFVLLVVALLAGGLVTLLMLNTKLAENSVKITELNQRAAALADQEQALRQQVAAKESPQRLAEKAKAQGMVPGDNPVFLDPADGSVHGVPRSAGVPTRGARRAVRPDDLVRDPRRAREAWRPAWPRERASGNSRSISEPVIQAVHRQAEGRPHTGLVWGRARARGEVPSGGR